MSSPAPLCPSSKNRKEVVAVERCRSCSSEFDNRKVVFDYRGVEFILSGSELCFKCALEMFAKMFEEYCQGIITLGEGEIVVDWDALCNLTRGHFGTYQMERRVEQARVVYQVLEKLGVLIRSWNPQSDQSVWVIMHSDGGCLNPCLHQSQFYFTKRTDAESYTEAEYGDRDRDTFYICEMTMHHTVSFPKNDEGDENE